MKFIFGAFLFLISFQGTLLGNDWFQGMWQLDANQTKWSNPGMTDEGVAMVRQGFDQYAGVITINSKRIKCKKAKMGVPYNVVWNGGTTVVLEGKGGVVEMVKAFRPDLRKTSLKTTVVRINPNLIMFEVPAMQTIRMYLRRVG